MVSQLLNNSHGWQHKFKSIACPLLISLVLTACGGGGSGSSSSQTPSNPTTSQPPTDSNEPTTPPLPTVTLVPFNFEQLSQNRAYRGSQVQSASFVNATGSFRLPLAEQNLQGNITVSVDIEDPDGINAVYVGFDGASSALQLCNQDCNSTNYHRTITGINPLLHGKSSGPLQLNLMVADLQGNLSTVNTVSFFWQQTPINGFSASRSAGAIALNWQSSANLLRYNVYSASQPGVNNENFSTLNDPQAFLALREPHLAITGKEDAKTFYATVTGVDGSGESAFAETIEIAAMSGSIDLPPTAGNDFYVMDEDNVLNDNLLANDSDPESPVLTVNRTPLRSPKNGALLINSDGTFSYTPQTDFNGRDNFRYQISDGLGHTASADVVITVQPGNDAPEANVNGFNVLTAAIAARATSFNTGAAQAPLSVAAPGLLINDLDIDGNNLTLITTPISGPSQGTLVLNSDGSFVYNANLGATGEDQFTYQSSDGAGGLGQATVRITIDGNSFFPRAATDRYRLNQGQTFAADNSTSLRQSILANDTDLDVGDVLTLNTNLIRGTVHGTLNLAANGTFVYTPNAGYYGNDSFVYEITDLQSNTARAGVLLTVERINSPPIAQADNYSLSEDTRLTVNSQTGVLVNDSDPDFDPITLNTTLVQQPSNGQVVLASDGSFSYQPNLNFFGTDTFRYQISDSANATTEATVTLSVTNVNDVPIANNDSVQTEVDVPVDINVLANDTDVENQTLTVVAAVTSNGSVTINPDQTLRYVPPTGFAGNAQINYSIDDGGGVTAAAIVTVTITNANQIPVAVNDAYSLNEDAVLNVDGNNLATLLANDSDPDGDPLSVTVTPFNNTSNGILTLASDGTFSYQPNSNFFGSDSFSYQINDGQGGSAVGSVSLTINSINDAPVANDDVITGAENTLISINVLSNDSDIDNDALTVTSASAANGSTTIAADNSLNYLPNNHFIGIDIINYSVSDNKGGVASARVTVTVQNINDPPVALNDTATTSENTPVTINVLANDSDIDGDTLSVLTATASNASLSINANNSITYSPNSNFNGSDTINYTIGDGNGGTASAQVQVTVLAVNDNPVATNDSATTPEDTAVTINVLSNDFDADGDTLTVTSAQANNGNVSINSNNSLSYQPAANFNGNDSISYSIADGNGGSASAVVSISVSAVNDAPVANPDNATTSEDSGVIINVLANDSDVDNSASSLTLVSANANNGTVTIAADQTLFYQPNANFNGVDTISYRISDNSGGFADSSVSVNVVAINDGPIAQNDNAATNEDSPVTINVLANDSDPDGDNLSVTSASANNGQVVINSDHSLSYTPNLNFNGNDQINYVIADVQGLAANALVSINVAPVNDLPIAIADSATTSEDQPVIINVLANDSDVDSAIITITSASALQGQVEILAGTRLSYLPNINFSGSDTISYSISDNDGGSATAQVSVNITAVNDFPLANNDSATTAEDTSIDIAVLANDSDPDGNPLSVTSATASNGTASISANGTVSYTPNANFNGNDNIAYAISDNAGGSANAIVAVTITPVNDLPIAINDNAIVSEDDQTTINVLANDSDIDGDTLTVTSAIATTGTVTIAANQTLNYQPNSNFNGLDTISYSISDGNGGNASSTVTLSVTAINDNPTANPDIATTNEDVTITVPVLANDSDIDGDTLSVSSASASHGGVTINPDQSVNYSPNANYHGVDVINYVISDGVGGSASSNVAITVISVNDLPVAIADSSQTNEDTSVDISVLINDSDIDGDSLSITAASASVGSVTIISSNLIRFTPSANFNGIATINYTISDGNGGTANANVAVTVNAINDAPVAQPDSATTNEDVAVTINVLANDSDLDSDTLQVQSASASNGTVVVNSNGSVDYTPNLNFFGNDQINYSITDGNGGIASSTVAVTVISVNDLPLANSDTASTDEDVSVNINVLANDSDIDGDSLTITAATASQGSVTISTSQSLNYTPADNFHGTATINYTISDGHGGSASSTVAVTVLTINDPPTPTADTLIMDEDNLADLDPLANDSDIDGDALTITSATANHGQVTIQTVTLRSATTNAISASTLSYQPTANYNGADTINYTISDGNGGVASSTVSITINPINDLPVAVNDSANTSEDTSVNINVLANDSDADGEPLRVTTATALHGSVVIQTDNSLQYSPNANYNGSDTINYTIADAAGITASATVSVTISAINDLPVALADSATLNEDATTTINALNNDSDADGDTLSVTSATASHGSVTINSDKTLNYVPQANFNGSDTINYAISDGQGGTANTTVAVTVNAVNDIPVALSDTATGPEDTSLTIAVLNNDSDIDGDTLTIASASATNGTVSVNANNALVYTPSNNFNGNVTLNYTISDGNGGTASAVVAVTITAVNDLPIAVNDSASGNEDNTITVAVLTNDSDVDGDTLTVQSTSTTNGTVLINRDQTLIYTPSANFNGTTTVNYQISDNNGGTASAVLTITVAAVNDAPVAVADNKTTAEDTATNITVLANDTDVEGDTLTITAATASHGTVTFVSGTSIDYTPTANYFGADTINYTISDGNGGTASSTVAVTITSVNDIPVAVADSKTTAEDTATNITVLANDTDVEGDTLTITAATASHGSVTFASGTSIDYTPTANYFGADTISYTISDGNGGSASSTVAVTVTSVNDIPVAVADSKTTAEDTATNITVLANDTDVEGDTLTITAATASHGTVTFVSGTSIDYTPTANYFGADTISYTISDGNGGSASSTVAVTITSVNDIPVAVADSKTTAEDTATNITVLANDTDVEGDTLTITAATASHGSVTFASGTSIDYTPTANYFGADTINYTISDGNGGTASSSVAVTITSVNDIPVAVADSKTTAEDTATNITVLANDTDVEGDTLTITAAAASHGSVTFASGTSIDYTPTANYFGADTINYTISDGNGGSASSTVAVTVTSVNDIPVAVADSKTTAEDTATNITVLANDTDVEGDTLTITAATASHGTVTFVSGTSIDYTPTANYFGADTINYTISDGNGGSASSTVAVTVTSVNDIPVAVVDSVTVTEDTPKNIVVLANDSDVDGDTLTVTSASASNGSIVIETNQSLTYTPTANFTGSDTINYDIADGNGGTASTTVAITVSGQNDNPVAVADTATTTEDTSVLISVLANDSDADGDTLTITAASASNGTPTYSSGTQINYQPSSNFNGSDTIYYTISDGNGGSASTTVTVTISPVNDLPIATTDTASATEDTLLSINVINNDIDVDNDALTVTSASAIAGTVVIQSNQSLDYTPNLNVSGSDTISYAISDGNGGTANGVVNVTIAAVNDVPVAVADTASTNEDTLKNIAVLGNDTDADGDSLSVTAATAVNGVLTIKVDNSLDYVPNVNFNGSDTISYTISDGNGGTASSSASITVNPVNDTPVYNDAAGSIAENSNNGSAVITMTGSDIDTGDILTYSIVSGNNNGIFALDANTGAITIADNTMLNFENSASHSLVLKATDSGGLFDTATATITVTNVEENVTPTLDPTFGTSGTASSNAFASDNADATINAILDSNGKMVVVGSINASNEDIYVTRFNSDGSIDRTFGTQGVVNLDLGSAEVPVAVAIDSQSKIVVAGTQTNGSTLEVFVVRFSSDGALDTSFNSNGYRITSFGLNSQAADIKIASDGTIVVAANHSNNFVLIEIASNGASESKLDIDFAAGIDYVSALALQSDGKAILVGATLDGGGPQVNFGNSDFAIARVKFSPSTQLDTSYGNSGTVSYDLGNSTNDYAYAALMTSNDDLFVAGASKNGNSFDDTAFIKLDSTGSLVNSFASSGMLVVDVDNNPAVHDYAKRLVADPAGNLYFGIQNGNNNYDVLIYKTDALGSPITAYGHAGIASFDYNATSNPIGGVVIDSSDRILIATGGSSSAENNAIVGRFNTSGSLETSYHSDGYNIFDPTFGVDTLSNVIELTTGPEAGKLVAIGTTSPGHLIVARYTATGVLDETFGVNGYFTLTAIEVTYEGAAIVESNDGKLYVVGSEDTNGFVIKLNSNGTLDNTFGSNTGRVNIADQSSGATLSAAVLDRNNKLVIGGTGNGGELTGLYLARLNQDGTFDTNSDADPGLFFNAPGFTVLNLFASEQLTNITALSDGSIIAVGVKAGTGLVAKFLENGSIDTAGFGASNGYVSIDLDKVSGVNTDMLTTVKVKSNGKIVAAGYTTASGVISNTLVQLNSDGSLDTSFDSDAIANPNYGSGDAAILGLDLDNQDRILITGYNSNGSNKDIFVARIDATGAKDTLFNSTGGILFDYQGQESAKFIKVRSDGSLLIGGSDDLNLFPTSFFFLQKFNLVEP